MIYFILILFFASLISIAVMIGRKIILLRNGQVLAQEDFSFQVPYLKEIKNLAIKSIKKYEHWSLVLILRLYVKSALFIKSEYQELKNKIRTRIKKSHINSEKQEVSKFLKMISDYKHRVKEIKHRIKKEEEKES